MNRCFAGLSLLALTSLSAIALELDPLFTDHMVVQQGQPIRIWGAARGEASTVEVQFGRHRANAEVFGGRFRVELPALPAGGPYRVQVNQGDQRLELSDVWVGEVWVGSGQSNMAWPIRATAETSILEEPENPEVRVVRLGFNAQRQEGGPTPVAAGWSLANRESLTEFSAVGYAFARRIADAKGVKVGIIQSAWGGTRIETWLPRVVLAREFGLRDEVVTQGAEGIRHRSNASARVAAWQAAQEAYFAAQREGRDLPPWPERPDPFERPNGTGNLYAGMLVPLHDFPVQGVLWYQGESNSANTDAYAPMLRALIRELRRDWRNPNLSVQIVQLPGFMEQNEEPVDRPWARLREAQRQVARDTDGVGLTVILDLGDPDDIHPQQKDEVGARLSELVLRTVYGSERRWTLGPALQGVARRGNELHLTFDQELTLDPSEHPAFAITGGSGEFVWANAEVRGRTIVLSAPAVTEPVQVRYAWDNFPRYPLRNRRGDLASPFEARLSPPN